MRIVSPGPGLLAATLLFVATPVLAQQIFAWDGATQFVLLDTAMNISSFGEDEQGELYVVHLGGSVSRIDRVAPCT